MHAHHYIRPIIGIKLVFSDLSESIRELMVREVDGSWTCNQCSFNSPYATTMTNHVEARHLRSTDGYSCQLCGKHCPTKNALKCHTYRVHGGQKNTTLQ